MCGIGGMMSLNNEISTDLLESMSSSIHHRGPDSQETWLGHDGQVGLCHTRLAILDLSKAGSQPMVSNSGRYVIVFNGEIYNHLSLRTKLSQDGYCYDFRGRSDTETMLACFENWGLSKTIKSLSGMFSIALWDNVDSCLYLCRDRYGEKPLYYGTQNGNLFFASELKSICSNKLFKSTIDKTALLLYFRYSYIPSPYSIYSGISKLTPGTILKIDSLLKFEYETFWDSSKVILDGEFREKPIKTDNEWVSSLDELLHSVISDQQLSDVPLGTFMSGGIDSTLVTAILQSQTQKRINTYTIGFEEKAYNEAPQARKISKYLNTNHEEVILRSNELIDSCMKMASIFDEPFADSSQIPTYYVSKLAKNTVTVALTGDGADEVFLGYNRYVQSSIFANVPTYKKHILKFLLSNLNIDVTNVIYNLIKPGLPKYLRSSNFRNHISKFETFLYSDSDWDTYHSLVSIINSNDLIFKDHINFSETNNSIKDTFDLPLSISVKMQMADIKTYLVDDILCKVDRTAMSVSLETRAPFLDHRVLEFASNLPLNLKIRNGQGKWILKTLLQKYLPADLMDRPKIGFGIPLDLWLRGPLKQWAESLLIELRQSDDEFLDYDRVNKVWQEHLRGTKSNQFVLWNIFNYILWKKNMN